MGLTEHPGAACGRERFAEAARTYGPAMYRAARAVLDSDADAEDVMQEVFLTLLRKGPDRFDSGDHARAWLLRVTAQRAADHFRRVSRRREEPLDESLPAPERDRGETLEAVLALPPELPAAFPPLWGHAPGGPVARFKGAAHQVEKYPVFVVALVAFQKFRKGRLISIFFQRIAHQISPHCYYRSISPYFQ